MQKVLNIAHRGFTREFPDNTLESFYAAIKLKADGIECDVHETVDHHFIIFHNDNLLNKPISELTLKEIRKVRLYNYYQIPTLEETLDLCHKHIRLMLEIKQAHSLDLFLEIVNSRMSSTELFITSFQTKLIRDLADFAPQIQRGILIAYPVEEPLKLIESTRAKIVLPRFSALTGEMVHSLHSGNISTIVWDCNSISEFHTALKYNVDGIITDSPDVLAQELNK
ncbi:MAG: glycerophosphodiester phosphodiesterase [Dehalococcoidales bacterium]|nr:glycerophosphodiester phosphodiesterase [Dehalococcoidales bacterium]